MKTTNEKYANTSLKWDLIKETISNLPMTTLAYSL